MFEIGADAITLTQYSDIANTAIKYEPDINSNKKTTPGGRRYTRSTGKPIEDYTVTFSRITLTQFNAIAQYCSPRSIKNYYVKYTNTINDVVLSGFARLVLEDIEIDHDTQLYTLQVKIEME